MACRVIDFSNPYFWIFCASCFLGFTIAQATILPDRTANPYRAGKWKWSWVFIFLSFFIGIGTAGFFAAGYESFLFKEMILYGGIVSGVAFLGFRFKKAAGIPITLILIAFIVYFSMMTSTFSCPPRESLTENSSQYEISTFRLLDSGQDELRFEIGKGDTNSIIEIPGRSASPAVSVLQIGREYILFGGRTLYIFHGMYSEEFSSSAAVFPETASVREEGYIRYSWIQNFAGRLPGIDLQLLSIDPFLPVLFQRYSVFLSDHEAEDVSPVLRAEPSF